MVEHVAITDPNIHKTKGVAAASNGTVHAASSGDGVWVNPYTLTTTRKTQVLQASHVTNQLLAAADTPQTVLFGAAQALTDVSIASTGLITINTTGFYEFKFNLNFGRTTGTGASSLFARLLINGSQYGFVQAAKLDTAGITFPFQADVGRYMTSGDVLQVQIMRDSVGSTDGGLIAVTPTNVAFSVSPSSWVRVTKVEGTI